MSRRRFVALAVGASLTPVAGLAQREKVHRIGVLLPVGGPGGNMDAFYKALADLGYVEGRNLVVERRQAERRDDAYAALASELARLPVDVLVAAGPSATRAARGATTTIPIVMGTVDAVEQGVVASLARPGGNVTGWTLLSTESAEKQLSLLKEAMPRLAHVAVLANPRMPAHARVRDHVRDAARRMNMRVTSVEVPAADALEAAFATMLRERVEGFFVVPDPVVMDHLAKELALLARQHRLPGMYEFDAYVRAGGLMSYGPSLRQLVASWATHVDKILRGAKPADLPVETPRKYNLVLNERTARELGFVFPPALRLAADEIIS